MSTPNPTRLSSGTGNCRLGASRARLLRRAVSGSVHNSHFSSVHAVSSRRASRSRAVATVPSSGLAVCGETPWFVGRGSSRDANARRLAGLQPLRASFQLFAHSCQPLRPAVARLINRMKGAKACVSHC